MNTRLFAVCGVVALLVVSTGGAVAMDAVAWSGTDRGWDSGSHPAENAASNADNDNSASNANSNAGGSDDATTEAEPFTVIADNTEKCGRTCRDVTSTVTNQQNTTAEDVSVSTRVHAGNDTRGVLVWKGSENVGTLEADESHTATERIELSLGQAISVERAGGWITITTTIETTDQTVTLTEQRQVT